MPTIEPNETHIYSNKRKARAAALDKNVNFDEVTVCLATNGNYGWVPNEVYNAAVDADEQAESKKETKRGKRGKAAAAAETEETTEAGPGDEGHCLECGEAAFVDGDGTSHHTGDGMDGVDFHADADHVAVVEKDVGSGGVLMVEHEGAVVIAPLAGKVIPPGAATDQDGDDWPTESAEVSAGPAYEEPEGDGREDENEAPDLTPETTLGTPVDADHCYGLLQEPTFICDEWPLELCGEVTLHLTERMLPYAALQVAEKLAGKHGTVLLRDANTGEVRAVVSASKAKSAGGSSRAPSAPRQARDYSERPAINSERHKHVEKILDKIEDAAGDVGALEALNQTFKRSSTYYIKAGRYLDAKLAEARAAEAANDGAAVDSAAD